MEQTSTHLRGSLLSELVDSVDDILQRIYDAKPALRPTETKQTVADSEEATTVKTQQLIDRCYQVGAATQL